MWYEILVSARLTSHRFAINWLKFLNRFWLHCLRNILWLSTGKVLELTCARFWSWNAIWISRIVTQSNHSLYIAKTSGGNSGWKWVPKHCPKKLVMQGLSLRRHLRILQEMFASTNCTTKKYHIEFGKPKITKWKEQEETRAEQAP